jgi:hypothetical protein
MKCLLAVLPPLIILLCIVPFISRLWWRLNKLKKLSDVNEPTTELSERIYKNFEFFVKIFLALVGGFGYVKFTYGNSAQAHLAQRALMGIGAIGMVTMVAFVLSVASLQAWKIPRWQKIDWTLLWTWQEIYMMFAMYLLATALWIAAIFW